MHDVYLHCAAILCEVKGCDITLPLRGTGVARGVPMCPFALLLKLHFRSPPAEPAESGSHGDVAEKQLKPKSHSEHHHLALNESPGNTL